MKTMMIFDSSESEEDKNNWRYQLDEFVKEHQQELAALAWGLRLEKPESDETLGIDLKPTPHFVYCSRGAIAELNRKVEGKIQEILGIMDGYKPEEEVLAIAIGDREIKLIYFQPAPSPADCFQQIGDDVDTLLNRLEETMSQQITEIPEL